MSLFDVAKGEFDIQIVFDGTACGLNDVLWAPWFSLPTVDSMFRQLDVGFWSTDNDFGEMFYNFWLHETLQNLCGVDLTKIFTDELTPEQHTLWERWCRTPMGLKPSPYQAVAGALHFKRVLLGDPSDETNVYQWSRVVVNIPGSVDYQVGKPWVYKERADGFMATDVCIYVDDGRSTAKDEETAWLASSKFGKTASWLGLQDAARKRMGPSQNPEPWFGAKASTTADGVYRSTAQKRWDKTKSILSRISGIMTEAGDQPARLEYAQLRRDTGFLMYICMTYKAMAPYMKGFYLTLYGWRSDRGEDGWKLTGQLLAHQLDKDREKEFENSDAPHFVEAVSRLWKDVEAMMRLTQGDVPRKIRVRPAASARVYVGFGDASKSGFGVAVEDVTLDTEPESVLEDDEVYAEHGLWAESMSNQSSNHRELGNFVLFLERAIRNGRIPRGTEIFLFTDNFVAERAYFRGTASTELLFELVLRLRVLEMNGDIFLNLIWCAGTRMIECGVDALSRGDLDNGMMAGNHVLTYVPIHQTAFERSERLREWVSGWVPEGALFFDTEDWFHSAYSPDYSCGVWAPAPAIADVALEHLTAINHMQPCKFHVIIIPTVMTYKWRRTLKKVADVEFEVPFGNSVWPTEMHEKLTIAIVCPLLNRSPWHLRPTHLATDLSENLSGVWTTNCAGEGLSLRKFWSRATTLDTMPGSLARELLQTVGR